MKPDVQLTQLVCVYIRAPRRAARAASCRACYALLRSIAASWPALLQAPGGPAAGAMAEASSAVLGCLQDKDAGNHAAAWEALLTFAKVRVVRRCWARWLPRRGSSGVAGGGLAGSCRPNSRDHTSSLKQDHACSAFLEPNRAWEFKHDV